MFACMHTYIHTWLKQAIVVAGITVKYGEQPNLIGIHLLELGLQPSANHT